MNRDLLLSARSLYPAGHPAVLMLVTGPALITEFLPVRPDPELQECLKAVVVD